MDDAIARARMEPICEVDAPGRDHHGHVGPGMAARVDLALRPRRTPPIDQGDDHDQHDQQGQQDRVRRGRPVRVAASGRAVLRPGPTRLLSGVAARENVLLFVHLSTAPVPSALRRCSTQVCSSRAAAFWSITSRWSRAAPPFGPEGAGGDAGRQPLVHGDHLDGRRAPGGRPPRRRRARAAGPIRPERDSGRPTTMPTAS